jgi:hypothetical protein
MIIAVVVLISALIAYMLVRGIYYIKEYRADCNGKDLFNEEDKNEIS